MGSGSHLKLREGSHPGSSGETSKKLDGVWVRAGAWEAACSLPQPQFPPCNLGLLQGRNEGMPQSTVLAPVSSRIQGLGALAHGAGPGAHTRVTRSPPAAWE